MSQKLPTQFYLTSISSLKEQKVCGLCTCSTYFENVWKAITFGSLQTLELGVTDFFFFLTYTVCRSWWQCPLEQVLKATR